MKKMKIAVILLIVFAGILLAEEIIPQKVGNSPLALKQSPRLTTHTEYYFFCKAFPDSCLDVERNLPQGKIWLWKPNTSYAQRFYFTDSDVNGLYFIKKGQHYTFLGSRYAAAENEQIPVLFDNKSDQTVYWRIIPSNENNYYYLTDLVNGKLLTVQEIDGHKEVIMSKFSGEDNQKWLLEKVHK